MGGCQENLSEEFYKKGLNQVIGGIVAVGVVREFCKDLQVHKVVISFIAVFIAVVPAAVFQIRDYRKMKMEKENMLLKARIKARKADSAVNRVKAMREERKIRKRSVRSFMYDYGGAEE